MLNHALLSWMIWLPIAGAVCCLIVSSDQFPNRARVVAIITALLGLALCFPLVQHFDYSTFHMQYVEQHDWIPAYGIYYSLGVDGLSVPLIILTCLTTLVVVLAACTSIHKKVGQYMATFLVMQGLVIGVFSALDSILFYVFWEAMLIPMYLSIGIWGSANRSYASIKFFIYTFFGSALMLAVILYLRLYAGSFAITDFYHLKLSMPVQIWLFIGFLLAFMVKVPMWPTHTWLPDAHTEAPAGGSVVLAALMLKLGTYGFFRFSMPIVPDACQCLATLMIVLSLISIIYISYVALVQKDMKRLIAYSSIGHMGFVTLGCFMVYWIMPQTHQYADALLAYEGAMVQMIAHAFGAGAMFIGVGILYDQLHSRSIKDYGGIAHKMPLFAALYMLFCLSNTGLPGTSGFVGEFMILLAMLHTSFWVTLLAATAVILTAAYTLWMYKRVYFGPIINPKVEQLQDIGVMETTNLLILAAALLFLGLYPQAELAMFQSTADHLLHLSLISKL